VPESSLGRNHEDSTAIWVMADVPIVHRDVDERTTDTMPSTFGAG
jgi:hypothetical protein